MEEYRDLFSHLITQSRRYEHPKSNIVLSAIILDVLLKNDNKMFIDRLVPEVKLSRELVLEGLRELYKAKYINFIQHNNNISCSIPDEKVRLASRVLEQVKKWELMIKQWLETPIDSSLMRKLLNARIFWKVLDCLKSRSRMDFERLADLSFNGNFKKLSLILDVLRGARILDYKFSESNGALIKVWFLNPYHRINIRHIIDDVRLDHSLNINSFIRQRIIKLDLYELSKELSHSKEEGNYILELIKDLILSLKNQSSILDDFNEHQFKELPYLVYVNMEEVLLNRKSLRFNRRMINMVKNLYGFIYLATNTQNGKIYVGQTSIPRTIEIEWGDLFYQGKKLRKERTDNPHRKIKARHILNAIAKYPDEVWRLELIDIAYSKEELNEKETYYIMEVYHSMDRKKGYDMTEGGEGTKGYGVKECPNISEFLVDLQVSKFQNEVLIKYNIDRVTMYKWIRLISGNLGLKNYSSIKKFLQNKNISEVTKEFAKIRKGINSKYLNEEINTPSSSEYTKDLWKERVYQERVENGRRELYNTEQFQRRASERQKKIWASEELRRKQSKNTKESWENNPEFEERAIIGLKKANKARRKTLPNIKDFLLTIKNATSYKEVTTKFDISHPLMQRRIKELLSPFGVGGYVDAKLLLAKISINKILDELGNLGIIDKLVDLGYFKK